MSDWIGPNVYRIESFADKTKLVSLHGNETDITLWLVHLPSHHIPHHDAEQVQGPRTVGPFGSSSTWVPASRAKTSITC
jgi:hypothetical protein